MLSVSFRMLILNPSLASAGLKPYCSLLFQRKIVYLKPVSGFGWIETNKRTYVYQNEDYILNPSLASAGLKLVLSEIII